MPCAYPVDMIQLNAFRCRAVVGQYQVFPMTRAFTLLNSSRATFMPMGPPQSCPITVSSRRSNSFTKAWMVRACSSGVYR